MGLALETIIAYDTDNTAITDAILAIAQSSLTIKAGGTGEANIIAGVCFGDGNVQFRIRSPRLHDNVRGIEIEAPLAIVEEFWPKGIKQKVQGSDDLIVTGFSGGAAADIGIALWVHYADVGGMNARLVHYNEIESRIRNIVGLRVDLATLTLGVFSGEQTLVADSDVLKSDTDYAILGAVGNAEVTALCVRGPDTGNVRIGIPVNDQFTAESARWLQMLNWHTGLPTIPIIAHGNRNATLVDAFHPVAVTTPSYSLIMAELG